MEEHKKSEYPYLQKVVTYFGFLIFPPIMPLTIVLVVFKKEWILPVYAVYGFVVWINRLIDKKL